MKFIVSRFYTPKSVVLKYLVYEYSLYTDWGIDGTGVSSNSIKSMIREIVDGENPNKPYSDLKIANMLGTEGIEISRRTVAKYREDLGILSSSRRRKF